MDGDLTRSARRFQTGVELLRAGRWPEGWPMLEERVRLAPDLVPPGPTSYPEWRGEPLEGRSILVWIEQGLGDQIMFGRFAGLLKARGAGQVTLVCRPPVAPVLATIPGVDAVIPIPVGAGAAIPRHQLWTRYFSLPWRLGITLETLPSAPYVQAPAARPQPDVQTPGRFGLVWRTSATGAVASAKTLPPALAERLGDLVGKEMACFGVHLWLAPALNIHRDIRCGLNFEYYSEDPFLAGQMGTAWVQGAQSAGAGSSLKHFAANSQEFQRRHGNIQLDERTQREIYLPAFEATVREAMTI